MSASRKAMPYLHYEIIYNMEWIYSSRMLQTEPHWPLLRARMWELDYKESWVPKNWCFWAVVLEKTLESPLDSEEIQPVHLKEISPECSLEGLVLKLKFQYFGHWCEELTHWKSPWFWERLKAGGEGENRGWDGWMTSLTQWTWVWASSESWWWIGRPGMLQFMGSQRVTHDWATELNWSP